MNGSAVKIVVELSFCFSSKNYCWIKFLFQQVQHKNSLINLTSVESSEKVDVKKLKQHNDIAAN